MLSWTRPGRVVTGGLMLAALAGGSARAQEVPNLPPLDPAAAYPPAAVTGPMMVPGAGMIGPATVAGPGHHVVPRAPVRPDLSDRETRKFWRRYRCQDQFLGYPEEFPARPLGASVYENNRAQVANGEAAAMVLYDYDFEEGSNKLNLHGQDRLAEIMRRLPVTFHPVIVERTPRNPGLDEVRRLAVLAQIARSPFPVPSERVVVGAPLARGLDPVDAEIIHNTRVTRAAQAGPPLQTGDFGAGGTAGGGGAGAGVGAAQQ